MGDLWILLGKHAHDFGVVVLKGTSDVTYQIVNDFERISELRTLSEFHPIFVVDDVVPLLSLGLDSRELGEAMFEEVKSGQVGLVSFSQGHGNFIDEIVRHYIA